MLKRFSLCACVFMLLIPELAIAQGKWKAESGKIQSKTDRIEWLFNAVRNKPEYSPDHGAMLTEALRLSRELNIDSMEALAHHKIGYYYKDQGDMKRSWHHFQVARTLYLRNRMYDKLTKVLYNQCELFVYQFMPDSLIKFLDYNAPLIRLSRDEKMKTYLKIMYAVGFEMSGNKARAAIEHEKLLPVAYERQDTNMIVSTLMNIAMLQEKFDSAIFWYRKGLSHMPEKRTDHHMNALYAEILFHIGFLFNGRDDALRDSALFYFLKAEKNIEYLNPVVQIELSNIMGDFFSSKNEHALALKYYRKAYGYSASSLTESGNISMNNLAHGFIKAGQLDSAAKYLKIYREWLERQPDNNQNIIYHETMALFEAAKGDSCSDAVIMHYDEALLYSVKMSSDNARTQNLLRVMRCLKEKRVKSSLRNEISLRALQYCRQFYASLKRNAGLANYAKFLEGYAMLESGYGRREHADSLYLELVGVLNRMNEADYLKGVDEAVIKYKTDLKDTEIALLTEKEKSATIRTRIIIAGLAAVLVICLLIFLLYQREHKIRQLLDEKNHKVEQLLREVHHRVKNNLQIVSSFIHIQLDRVKDDEAREALQDTSSRILALAGLHQSLYRQEDLSKIHVDEYIKEVCQAISGHISNGITINCSLESLELDIDHAIPLGLAVNELITNSVKHAFRETGGGVITVSLHQEKEWILKVKDNGRGLPPDQDILESDSIGVRLVQDIAERQLKGNFSWENQNGAAFIISFADPAG